MRNYDDHYFFDTVFKLVAALREHEYSQRELEKLANYAGLGALRDLVCGRAELVYPEKILDSDPEPVFNTDFINNIRVVEHLKLGKIRFNPQLVDLLLAPEQEKVINGKLIYEYLQGKKVLNAQVMHQLILNPCLIPGTWNNKRICFWGTLLQTSSDKLSVMTLNFMRDNFFWEMKPVDSDFHAGCVAAVLKDEAMLEIA